MKKSSIGYGFLVVLLVLFIWIWIATGEFVGAFLSLSVVVLIGGLVFAILAYFVSNVPHLIRFIRGVSPDDHLTKLEASGKAVREQYEATQALTVEVLNTGSIMHFIDVGQERILCLSGQYYFEFEPYDDDPELNQTRRFPTESFSLLRHRKTGDVLSLIPGSNVLEPTVCDPVAWPEKLVDLGFEIEDGEIVSGPNMDEIRQVLREARQ